MLGLRGHWWLDSVAPPPVQRRRAVRAHDAFTVPPEQLAASAASRVAQRQHHAPRAEPLGLLHQPRPHPHLHRRPRRGVRHDQAGVQVRADAGLGVPTVVPQPDLDSLSRVTERCRQSAPATVDRFRSMVSACPVAGYTGCCAALRDADLRDEIHRIDAPTLVVTGTHDQATPPSLGDGIRARIAGARGVELNAAHLTNVEQPAAFNAAVIEFPTH